MANKEIEQFEAALGKEWKEYNNSGAATVDALEDNTQELTFAKGFYRGWKCSQESDTSGKLGGINNAYSQAKALEKWEEQKRELDER